MIGGQILVTGHMGFVGQHLMRELFRRGALQVFCIDLTHGDNITNCRLPNEITKVYHLAAQTNAQSERAEADAYVNIIGTVRLLEKYGNRVVLASSSAINYPHTPYAISKLSCELYARMYGAAIVRFCNLYGEGGHSCWDVFERDHEITIYGNGEQVRTYAPVQRAVEELIDARPGVTRVLAGTDYSVNQLAAKYPHKTVRRLMARRHDPMRVTQ